MRAELSTKRVPRPRTQRPSDSPGSRADGPSVKKWRWRSARFLLALPIVALTVEAAWPPVYRFPPARAFSGARWYDPYREFDGNVLRANFHAHSGAWGGVSAGGGAASEIVAHYEGLGYDVPSISNYMSIEPSHARTGLYVPSYEHGYGVRKIHQTVIGSERVSWLDAPLVAMRRHKQYLLDVLAETAPVVVLNHPQVRDAYTPEDLQRLVGYQGLEIASKYARSTELWDVALSAGRPVWGFASDDGHHPLERESHSAIAWLCVSAHSRSAEGVIDALRAGSFYSVWDRDKEGMLGLRRHALDASGVLNVGLDGPADEIRFVGQDGRVLATQAATSEAAYELQPTDTYVRVEAVLGRRALYTNPVFRHSGRPFDPGRAEVRPVTTWTLRIAVVALGLLALRFVIGMGPRSEQLVAAR